MKNEEIFTQFFFTSNTVTIYGEYMAHIDRYEQKYCYMKFSNTKILRIKLMRITVVDIRYSKVINRKSQSPFSDLMGIHL